MHAGSTDDELNNPVFDMKMLKFGLPGFIVGLALGIIFYPSAPKTCAEFAAADIPTWNCGPYLFEEKELVEALAQMYMIEHAGRALTQSELAEVLR